MSKSLKNYPKIVCSLTFKEEAVFVKDVAKFLNIGASSAYELFILIYKEGINYEPHVAYINLKR